ncbi:hypothetical protein [Isoptericola sp. AK164]|uniref:hypothetical protein n=1 Tax=Isoptericola sp. AK164 TaxID=3024246 RepID=UPI002418908B|nr:hypothetical protein [Isoptericola sp. AK164]
MTTHAPEQEPRHDRPARHIPPNAFARLLLAHEPTVTDPRFKGPQVEVDAGYEETDEHDRFDAG